MYYLRNLLIATLLLASTGVAAQSLPRPAEFYFDADAGTARPVVALQGTGNEVVEKLFKLIERDPRANAETAQLAHIAISGGREDLGRELYRRVLARLQPNDRLYRPVMWNYGWDLHRSGDRANAFEQWRTLLLSRNVNAQWMPQTLALALWSLDRKDEAVQWYAAAVRSEPRLWRTSERFETLLPEWTADERAALAEVQAAWAENPPAW